jgi:HSP20 family protein
MANVTVRKEAETRPATLAQVPAWEPSRMMRDFFGWDPFREMAPFIAPMPATFMPSFEVKETKDAYLFKADVPGVKESDIQISLTGNRLTIAGKREAEKQEQTDTYYTYERSYGDFTRSFTLPDGVDVNNVQAELKEGVLSLSVKKLPEAQPKKIAIQSAAKKS